MSPRRRLPNRLPDRSDDSGGPLGRNLPPLTQVSSVSAGPRGAGSRGPGPGPGPRRLKPPSDSGLSWEEVRGGARDERQSDALSETEGGGGSRGPPSNRRREPSRDEGASGRGPSLRQFPANFSSSNPPPPKPDRSFSDQEVSTLLQNEQTCRHSRGSATLTLIPRPARVYANAIKLMPTIVVP